MPIRAAGEFSPALRAVCGAGVDAGLVLTPVAVLAAVLGAWRLGVDPGLTSGFFIAGGSLSRYQLWFAVATGAQASALILNRWVANPKMELPALAPEET